MRTINLLIKRCLDFVGSLVGLILFAPILLIIAVAIKVTSKGSVFFLQERLGKNGKIFRIVKFRTMVVNAEHLGDGLRVKEGTDPRITKIGRLLRKTSLDELPQLFNTLCGSMSLVGPRPPVVYHPYNGYENYPEWAKKRFKMRPGITGLAQSTVRNSATWDERIEIDNKYVENFNILLDFKIIVTTIYRVLKSEDIYASKNKNKNDMMH